MDGQVLSRHVPPLLTALQVSINDICYSTRDGRSLYHLLSILLLVFFFVIVTKSSSWSHVLCHIRISCCRVYFSLSKADTCAYTVASTV